MKIRVSVVVDIDPEVWTLNYGVSGKADITADVKSYIEDLAQGQLGQDGTDVLVRPR